MKHTFKTKLLAVLLTAVMLVALVPAFFSVAAPEDWGLMDENQDGTIDALTANGGNLAIGATIMTQHGPHNDPSWGWDVNLLNNSSLDRMPGDVTNGGYHPNTGIINRNHSEWIGYDFGSAKTFDTVVIYPCRDENGVCYGMPNAYTVEVSTNGNDWVKVYEVYDLAIPEFGPQVAQFLAVTAQYVRVNMLSLNASALHGTFAAKICELAVLNKGYEGDFTPYCPNLAVNKPTEQINWLQGNASWLPGKINDGDRYNIYTQDLDSHGQFAGWHSGGPGNSEITFDLEEVSEFNQIQIWPSTEKYMSGAQTGTSDRWGLKLPQDIVISISEDKAEWETLVEVRGLKVSQYEPIVYNFDLKEARYVRVTMYSPDYVKLSEIEIFNTNNIVTPGEEKIETVIKPGVNVAPSGDVIYSSITTHAGAWEHSFLNNGIVEADGGFTTGISGTAWLGYQFEDPTLLNKLVMYPSTSTHPDDTEWNGIPKTYRVEYSTDGMTWTVLANGTAAPDPTSQTPVTVTFAPTVVKMIRIWSDDIYRKPSDLGDPAGAQRIQLAEMEAYYDPSVLTSGEALFTPFYQVKENADASKHDLRVVLVTNLEKLEAVDAATVTLTFNLEAGGTKTLTKNLDGSEDGYSIYKTITAGDDTYTAADGYAIFGCVVVDIPDDAYTSFDLTIVDGNDTVLLDVSSK